MIVRRAATRDMDGITGLLVRFHCEAGMVPLSVKKVSAALWSAMQNNRVWVAVHGDEIAGVMGVDECTLWYSETPVLETQFFYIAPEHRGSEIAKWLLGDAKEYADHVEMPLFVSITNPNRGHDRSPATRMAVRAGYVPMGYVTKINGEQANVR